VREGRGEDGGGGARKDVWRENGSATWRKRENMEELGEQRDTGKWPRRAAIIA